MGTAARSLSVIVVLGLLLGTRIAGGGLSVRADIVVTANATSLPVYDLLELTFALPGLTIDPNNVAALNPYDPEQVDVWAIFTGPEGWQEPVPAFWAGAVAVTDLDHIVPVPGQGTWTVRYAPRRPGPYTYRLEQRVPGPVSLLAEGAFTATPAAAVPRGVAGLAATTARCGMMTAPRHAGRGEP